MDHGAAKDQGAKRAQGNVAREAQPKPKAAPAAPRSPQSPAPLATAPRNSEAPRNSGIAPSTVGRAKAPPPPPSGRRELPAPTPLVLPARLQTSTPPRAQAATTKPGATNRKAPPPPSQRRAQAQAANASAAKSVSNIAPAAKAPPSKSGTGKTAVRAAAGPNAKPAQNHKPAQSQKAGRNQKAAPNQDAARSTDAQWAAHLDAPRESGRARTEIPAEPPSLPNNLPLLNLEGEISALRPRPSELPPEPSGSEPSAASEPAAGAAPIQALPRGSDAASKEYRQKTPSDLSVLYQALPTNYPERNANLAAARPSQQGTARSRGYVPKAPHEFLPPPPPPNKRGASKSFTGEDDEAPTQARRPAGYAHALTPSAPATTPVPPPYQVRTPVPPAASMVIPTQHWSATPIPPPTNLAGTTRLPPPPPLPADLHGGNWDDQEWTDAKHIEAIQLRGDNYGGDNYGGDNYENATQDNYAPHDNYTGYNAASRNGGAHDLRNHSEPPAAPATGGVVHVDSVRPTALTVPAPSLPTFGLPAGWAPVAGASVLGAAISAGAFMLPDRGQLLVDVSNQGWASLRDAHVYVNDELVCSQSPCAVKVDAAPQRVRVTAPGYQPSAEESVVVSDGAVTLHKVQLGASADTGIEVQTSVPNLQLYVDGRRIGSLPRKVMGLPPGEHTLVVSGGDNFTTEERRIQLDPNQTLVISDLQPKLKAGTLELRAGDNAHGARVTLDGTQISLPFTGQLEPGRAYHLKATRDGYLPVEQTLTIDANNPVLRVPLALEPDASAADAESEAEATPQAEAPSAWSRRSRWRATARATSDASPQTSHADTTSRSASEKPSSSVDNSPLGAAMRQSVGLPADAPARESKATGSGSLSIVTSPSAVILLDGKPVGKTPKQLTVSAGRHSIVLIHESGRKRTSVNVEAGGSKTIKASF